MKYKLYPYCPGNVHTNRCWHVGCLARFLICFVSLTDFKKRRRFSQFFFFLCIFFDNFLPPRPILIILFLLERGYLKGGPILIWSSSDDMINNKITEISNSYEQINPRTFRENFSIIYELNFIIIFWFIRRALSYEMHARNYLKSLLLISLQREK